MGRCYIFNNSQLQKCLKAFIRMTLKTHICIKFMDNSPQFLEKKEYRPSLHSVGQNVTRSKCRQTKRHSTGPNFYKGLDSIFLRICKYHFQVERAGSPDVHRVVHLRPLLWPCNPPTLAWPSSWPTAQPSVQPKSHPGTPPPWAKVK